MGRQAAHAFGIAAMHHWAKLHFGGFYRRRDAQKDAPAEADFR
jgi:hypothetical protein